VEQVALFAGWQPSGLDLKFAGQKLPAANNLDWMDEASAFLRTWCAARRRKCFAFEEFREWAIEHGLGEPLTHHAWGVLPRRAVAEKLIESTDMFRPARSARTHSHPVRLWRVL
jgi:hypothetical protein